MSKLTEMCPEIPAQNLTYMLGTCNGLVSLLGVSGKLGAILKNVRLYLIFM